MYPPQAALNAMQLSAPPLHQMPPMQDRLAGVATDLSYLVQQLEAEEPTVRAFRDTEPQLGNYWQRLMNCSVTLHKIANDLWMQNSSPPPIPSQYSYGAPIYLPSSMSELQRPSYPPQYFEMTPYSSHP